MIFRSLVLLLLTMNLALAASLSSKVQHTLNSYCTDCHNAKKQKGKIRLDDFSSLSKIRKLEMLNKVEEQIYLEHMPPEDEEQPSFKERQKILLTVKETFKELGAQSTFRAHLNKYAYANYIDHDKLFSGEFKDLKGFTYDRQWLISEYIFDTKFNRLFNRNPTKTFDGKKRHVHGLPLEGVTNPFILPSQSGVRYYANEALSGGQLLTMIGNAEKFAVYLVDQREGNKLKGRETCLLYTSPSPRDYAAARMPSSA